MEISILRKEACDEGVFHSHGNASFSCYNPPASRRKSIRPVYSATPHVLEIFTDFLDDHRQNDILCTLY